MVLSKSSLCNITLPSCNSAAVQAEDVVLFLSREDLSKCHGFPSCSPQLYITRLKKCFALPFNQTYILCSLFTALAILIITLLKPILSSTYHAKPLAFIAAHNYFAMYCIKNTSVFCFLFVFGWYFNCYESPGGPPAKLFILVLNLPLHTLPEPHVL